MKKILLSLGLFSLVLVGKSQTVLNEIYTDPNTGKHEFFELYNSAVVGSQSVDCFTILTYWTGTGTARGWYVMDLPALSIGPKNFFVGAAANPFNTQSLSNVTPDFNWNDPNFRNGSTGGSLTKWQVNALGTGWDDKTADIPANFNDFLFGGNGNDYIVLVFVNGAISNGFIGGSNSGDLSSAITSLPNLPVTMNGCANFNVIFGNIGTVEHVISQPGTDNGYARTSDGKCGAWVKTSASVQHTPGLTNGGAAGLTGSLTTSQFISCNTGPGTSKVRYNITGVTGDASEAADFPVEVQLYNDNGSIPGQLDGTDTYLSSKFEATIAEPEDSFTIAQTLNVILVYKTKRGCFDKVVALANGCLSLPVNINSFTATRSHSNVMLKWETIWEQNNSGFAVERNTNGTWQQVAFVASLGQGGNSSDVLDYQYIDLNNTKGISQYRLRQIDFDNKSKYSEILMVRGDGQIGKIIVYPNPSMDGKLNVSFEDATVTRDVSLIDMSGRMIKIMKGVTTNNITIDNLTPGMYTLRVVVPETGEQTVEKIVVNKR